MPQLTAAELFAHPLFGKDAWEGEPTKAGRLDVAKGRGGPFKVAWEIHGHGDVKLVVSGHSPSVRITHGSNGL